MKLEGYKISGYDATYRKAVFDVNERGATPESRVLEIAELDSGTTFLIDFNSASEQEQRTGVWRKPTEQDHGKEIRFGSKGIIEQLKYSGRKRRDIND